MAARAWLSSSWLAALICLASAVAAQPIKRVSIAAERITLADLVEGRSDLASIDLGAAPAAGGSRVLTRRQLLAALAQQRAGDVVAPNELPRAVRVVREVELLTTRQLAALVRRRLRPQLAPGVALRAVHPRRPARVAAGYDAVQVTLTKAPRRAGRWSSQALLLFQIGGRPVARVSVPVELTVSEAAARPDVARGAPLTLVVRRGRIEVRVRGFAGTDADVGEVLPVTLRPSGKVVRARLLAANRALAVAGGR